MFIYLSVYKLHVSKKHCINSPLILKFDKSNLKQNLKIHHKDIFKNIDRENKRLLMFIDRFYVAFPWTVFIFDFQIYSFKLLFKTF